MSKPTNRHPVRDPAEPAVNGNQEAHWPYVGEPPVYAPLSPWTRFQGGGFYVMLFTIFGICWTILCSAGMYYGMRNVAIAKSIGFWDAVQLRAATGLWLWIQVWLYPVLGTQLASVLIRLYYKKKGKLLHQSIRPGRISSGGP